MNTILAFDLKSSLKRPLVYVVVLVLFGFGVFSGNKFNLFVGEGVFLNSPYSIGFITGILSLSIVFIACTLANSLLFKEFDSKIEGILFALPLTGKSFLSGRFLAFFLMTFAGFVSMMMGFSLGQFFRSGPEMATGFDAWSYIYPVLVFGFFNTMLVCSFLFFVAYTSRLKLLVVVAGLLLYVLYMVVMLFSNSPFMAGSMPQSLQAQTISAMVDPFGLSSYFLDSLDYTIAQRSTHLVPFLGYFLLNRIVFTLISILLLMYTFIRFSPVSAKKGGKKKVSSKGSVYASVSTNLVGVDTDFGIFSMVKSVLSFAKKDSIYLFKSISFIAICLLLIFHFGMEMYAEIEKGIRIPQKYASSGLMSETIIQNLNQLGMLLLVYFVNDVFWRSHTSGFYMIENSTYFSSSKLKGHFVSIVLFLAGLTLLLIGEGLIFQAMYGYFWIDVMAYCGVFVFSTLPLLLFTALLLWINYVSKSKVLALCLSVLLAIFGFNPIAKKLLESPLWRIFSDFNGNYSDFAGFGSYLFSFSLRLIFGACLIALIWLITHFFKQRRFSVSGTVAAVILVAISIFSGKRFLEGYQPDKKESKAVFGANYEKKYRSYKEISQPQITHVKTSIDLFPSKNAYLINGTYTLENLCERELDRILINFHPDLKMESARLEIAGKSYEIDEEISEIKLNDKGWNKQEKAYLHFTLSYKWFPVNGHNALNAIIANGSFMRISRYFPVLGYRTDFELQDEREKYGLSKAAPLKSVAAPEVFRQDFIDLDMTVSTEIGQRVIGTGDLVKEWQDGRAHFQYRATEIPFRFAVASARYSVKEDKHKGIKISILYDPKHGENVDHLLKNIKLTLDYCIDNFGSYPFRTITFAEVSSFTKGFAATAYPSAVFMTEDMIFHANISADKKQDVINELAGHELSHLWWGNSGINPDKREGAAMLTETLAMYTEMMLYKKMHGNKAMKERVRLHQQIYDAEKGFMANDPLYRVKAGASHIAYSKGAVVMVKLSELIGEENVNAALRNFLKNNSYPKKPGSLDLLQEFYKVSPENKEHIDRFFKEI